MPRSRTISHKLDAVRRVTALLKQGGMAERSACRKAGVPRRSFQLWSAQLASGGESALMPNYKACGRKPKWEINDVESAALRSLALMFDSQTFAIEQFAKSHADCRLETREAILNELDTATRAQRYPRWPVSLRRAVASTIDERAKFRGARHFEAISFSPRKGLFFTDEEGRRIPIFPHTVWTMDDYSANEPYIVHAEDGSQRLCRQILGAMDVGTDAWLAVENIGRERDAYRAEDILRFILRCIDGQGTMPLYLLLERGAWQSNAIHGLDLGTSREKGGLGPRYDGRRWGALDDLIGIIHGFSARHKAGLESSFNILQRALAHSGREIGRKRGEFEAATKDLLAVQAGRKDAEACGFLTLAESNAAHVAAMLALNDRGKMRAATGLVEIPNDLMAMWDAELDARKLPDSERWRFLPIKRFATVRGGFIEMTVAPYRQPFRFQINGTENGRYLPNGYRLLAAFDPAMPALGAYVCNGTDGTENRHNLPIGEFLMTAPHAEDVGQFDLRPGGYAGSSKQRASTAASTAFASISPFRNGLAVTARHDGRGDAMISRRNVKRAQDGLTGTTTGAERSETDCRRQPAGDGRRAGSTRRMPTAAEMEAIDRAAEENFAVT